MIKKYLALLRRAIGAILEYRAGVLIWMLVNVMPLVMLAVWFSLAEDGPIGGYAQADFVSYYLLLTFMRQMTTVWVIHELDYDIRHGDLSIKLLHPLNPLHEYMAFNLGDKIFRVIVLLPLALLAWVVFPYIHYDVTLLNLALMLVTMAAAWFMRFISQYTFGLLAFWISEAQTLHEIWYATWLMLGGVVAPLDLFPAPVAAIARYLPFRFMLSFPVELMLGRLSPADTAIGLGMTAFWCGVMVVAYRWVWGRGIKQFSAFGA